MSNSQDVNMTTSFINKLIGPFNKIELGEVEN